MTLPHVHKLAELYAELGDFQTSEKLDPQPGPGVLLLMRRYDEAIDQAQDLMLEDPSDVDVRFILASAYNATGQYELARHVLESTGLLDSMLENRVRSLSEMNAFVTLFNALAGIGTDMSVEMARSLAELNDSSTWHGDAAAVAVGRSCTLAVMGRHEEALALLPDARRGKRLIGIQWLKDAWCFQQYTNEPEYQEVLQDQEELRQRLLDRLPATLEAFGVKL